MITVHLHGEMGRLFGKSHSFAVSTGREAFSALKANFKSFGEFVIEGARNGKNYMVVIDDNEVGDAAQFSKNKADNDIHFVPIILGAGGDSGGWYILAAAVVVFFSGGLASGAVASFLTQLSISLAIAGITALLTKPPEQPQLTQTVSAGANSYFFGGRSNVAQQGHPVPIGYGRLKVGSQIIRSSVRNEDLRTIEDSVDFTND
tara:strand:+ start:19164 stop:19775 length:612 start_codon:yes stop_codon:yes gene_type:complete